MLRKLLCTLVFIGLFVPFAMAQSGTITGKVTDAETGETTPGANVLLVESERGTATGANGEYTIENVEPGTYTLRVTFVGYNTYEAQVEVEAGETVTHNVELETSAIGLDEVVVTGTGTVERGNLTQSISSVNTEDLEDVSITSTDAMLQGKAAGVTVTQSSGTPGSGVRVRIRGHSSISASNEPLYVVDGVPVTTGDFGNIFSGGQGLNALSTLNSEDIESMTVLKDASATAIYGSRGSNGVVLIETKEGVAGDTKLDFSYTRGSKSFNRGHNFMTGPEHVEAITEGAWLDMKNAGFPFDDYENTDYQSRLQDVNNNIAALFGAPAGAFGLGAVTSDNINQYLDDPSSAPTTDWTDAIFRTGTTDKFNISANGGNVDTRYFASATFFEENSIMINNKFQRMNGRLNLDHNVNDDFSINARISYNKVDDKRIENDNNIYGVLTNAQLATPTAPIRNDDGTFNSSVGGFSNPVAESQVTNQAITTRFVGSVSADYNVHENVTISGKTGLDRFDLEENTFDPSFTNQGSPLGSAFEAVTFNQRWFSEISANYSNTFADVHDIDAIVLGSWEENDVEVQTTQGTDFPSDQTRSIAAAATTEGSSTSTAFGLRSITSRINYSFDDRYLLTVNGRVDESSRFGEGHQAGFFPSASVAWRLSNESFMDEFDFLNQFKLRGSVGITGNQSGIDNFASRALYGVSSFNSTPTLAPNQLSNPNLKWEETTEYTVGLDLAVLEERFSLTVDVYKKDTDDLLLSAPIPATTGFTSFIDNIGSIKNEGIEISLNTVNLQKGDFRWSTSLNWTTYRNEVTKLVNDEPFNSGFANRVEVGEPLGAFYGYKTDGIWNTQEEIDNSGIDSDDADLGGIRYVDTNDDGKITSDDQTIVGNANPDFSGGITNTFNYKGFRLNVFVQYSYGNDVFNNSAQFYGNPGFITEWGVESNYGNKRWTPDNKDAEYPRASFLDFDSSLSRDNDFFMDDGSYLRVKRLSLSYTFPAEMLQRINMRSAEVFVTGTNLFTLTNYSGLDPEVNTFDRSNTAFGTDFFTFPQHRSIEFGINLGL